MSIFTVGLLLWLTVMATVILGLVACVRDTRQQLFSLRRQLGVGSPFGEASASPDQDTDGT